MNFILNSYIAKRFLVSLFYVFLIVISMTILIDLIELLKRSSGQDVSMGILLWMAVLRAPNFALTAAPFAVMLSAMWVFARFAKSSELVVMRASGQSVWRILSPALLCSLFVGVLAVLAFNPLSAAMLERAERLDSKYFKGNTSMLSVSSEGLWLRQSHTDGHAVIHALRSNSDGTELTSVAVLLFDDEDTFQGRLDAEKASLGKGFWLFSNVRTRLLNKNDPEGPLNDTITGTYTLPSELTSAQILDSFASPETLSFWKLPGFIRNLEESGFSARRHLLHWHRYLSLPLLFSAMLLIGAAFSMRHSRFGGLGYMALGGALTGFSLYFISDVSQALGASGGVPVVMAAWVPPISAIFLAMSLLLHLEDG